MASREKNLFYVCGYLQEKVLYTDFFFDRELSFQNGEPQSILKFNAIKNSIINSGTDIFPNI